MNCRTCGSESVKILNNGCFEPFFQARVFGSPFTFSPSTIVKTCWCPRCHTSSPWHEFSDAALAPLYRDYRQKSYNKDRIAVEPHYAHLVDVGRDPRLVKARNDAADSFLQANLRPGGPGEGRMALDYGGSDGTFTPPWVNKNWNTELYDPYGKGEPEPPYDLIVCEHVLEHVGNPLALVKKLAGMARYLYIEVPIDGTWAPPERFGIHEHINLFSRGSIAHLLHAIPGVSLLACEVKVLECGRPFGGGKIGRYLAEVVQNG